MVKITEPSTLITDFILGIYSLYLSVLIFQGSEQSSAFFLSWGFLAIAFGAFVGGISHGFKLNFSEKTNSILWILALYLVGFGAMFFLVSTALSSIPHQGLRLAIVLFVIIELIVYLIWVTKNDDFKYAIIDYGSSMILVIVFKIYSWYWMNDESSSWIIAGVLVSFIASAIQAMQITIHKDYFNHNDLFHVIQLPAMYLLFKGALLLKDIV